MTPPPCLFILRDRDVTSGGIVTPLLLTMPFKNNVVKYGPVREAAGGNIIRPCALHV